MSITVLTRRRARPGQGDALLEQMRSQLDERLGGAPHFREARVFQGLEAPDVILSVTTWDSSFAYWARSRDRDHRAQLDALCIGEPERYLFERLALYEDVSREAAVVSCTLVHSPPLARAAVGTVLEGEAGPLVRALPGLVLRHSYQHVDSPQCFLVLLGWDSLGAWQDFFRDLGPRLGARLREHGATVERFVGVTRARVDRGPLPFVGRPEAP
jgi:heme-degrading monooxygenase HmoA